MEVSEESTLPSTHERKRPRLGCCLAALLTPILILGLLALLIWLDANRPTYFAAAEDFSYYSVPEDATEIHCCQSVPFDPNGPTYSFSCSEESFRLWVESMREEFPKLSALRREGEPKKNDPFPIHHIMFLIIDREGEVTVDFISSALISDWRFEDEGFHLIYDLEKGRALRYSHSR